MDDEFSDVFMEIMDDGTTATAVVITLDMVFEIIMGTSLKFLWGMLNTLQFICYFSEVKVNLAVHAVVFLQKLKIIALGEYIPYEWITSHLRDKYEKVGEENTFERLGSMMILIGVLVIFTMLLIVTNLIWTKLGFSQRTFQFVKQKLFWNSFIRTSLHSYIKATFIFFSLMGMLKWSTLFDLAKSLASIIVVISLVTLPVMYACVLHKNWEVLGFTPI